MRGFWVLLGNGRNLAPNHAAQHDDFEPKFIFRILEFLNRFFWGMHRNDR